MPPRHHDASTAVPPQPPTLTLTPSNRPRLKGKGSKANLFFGLIPSPESCCYLPETALNRISDEEGICKTAFELLFAFDEVISLGHKENINVVQVKQYCEMESHEEKLHKLVLQSKINETKDVMKRKASEIDKSKIEKNRGDKGGFMSLQSLDSSGRLETGFGNDTNQSSTGSGFGNSGSGFGLSGTDVESFSTKSKGLFLCYFIVNKYICW
nr:coatomer subunit delta-like [Ipomoea batatas]